MADNAYQILPRPSLDLRTAARLTDELFGVSGPLDELGSHQDRNFRIVTDGRPAVLKVANRSWGLPAIQAQNAALQHLAARPCRFRAPVPLPGRDGGFLYQPEIDGERLAVRLLSFVDGVPVTEGRMSAGLVAELGALAAACSLALADFEHPGLDRAVQWDLQVAASVSRSLLASVPEPVLRERLSRSVEAASGRLRPVVADLRRQAVHGDITDDNVVGYRDEAGRFRPDAVIDFGDLVRSWLVAELAVLCASLLRHDQDPMVVLPAIRAWHELVPLTEAEVRALWPLIVLRGAVLVTSGEHQATLDPDNASATGPRESELAIFTTADAVPYDVAEAAIRRTLGLADDPGQAAAHRALSVAGRLFPAVTSFAVVDLSVTSDDLHEGRFADPDAEAAVLAAAGRSGPASTRYREARLTRTRLDAAGSPATIALGVDLIVPPGTELVAPWDVVVESADATTLLVTGPAGQLHLTGLTGPSGLTGLLAPGTAVAAGGSLGAVGPGGPGGSPVLRLRLCTVPGLVPPDVVTPAAAAGWTVLCPDPSPLLGVDVAAPGDDVAALLARREHSFARVQEHYFAEPMRIERGWRHHLFDTAGRAYVDLVNNVAGIGHSHPHLARAVHRQLRLLNTNSRFHYAAIAEFSERLAALAPPGLDTVLLVNSGSEAVDLALRMAQAATGRTDIVAVREAYHGWTAMTDAVTTSLYDNPTALETRPDWVHLASAPNPYRGRFRGPQAGAEYAAELSAVVARMVEQGRPPAAYLCEPVFGNAGGVLLPEGYLAAAYRSVRAAGGLCIADEVQVGYGRLGHRWWAHEGQGVVPDVITMAKAMGNGYPLGAVITTREIADAFAEQGPFFSSAGGSPAACVAGLAVLDVMAEEGLQANAAAVGDHLRARFLDLMDRHPIIGAVHGMGLYLGVELVVDRESREPATAACAAICERMRDLGVIMQPTGERANVLKVKPPLCLTRESADFAVDQLERVLDEGW